jgi:prepilin-type N-terminal cleavage/methylation domain-containing protein
MSIRGFTLIELMLAVAIIGLLAAVALPKFSDAVRRSVEGKTKGNLAILRASIAIYYGDNQAYPSDDLTSIRAGGYLKDLPMAEEPPYHPAGNGVCTGTLDQNTMNPCTNAWVYDNVPFDEHFGQVIINCTHSDLHGQSWSSY